MQIPLGTLCGSDAASPLRISVYDWDSDTKSDFIGSFEASLADLGKHAETNEAFSLINPVKRSSKKYSNSGLMVCKKCQVVRRKSFLDYIAGGTEISLSFAVDFTASNGVVTNPTSLHYVNPLKVRPSRLGAHSWAHCQQGRAASRRGA